MKCYIGIDPGKGGAIAVISNGNVVATTVMILTTKKKIDLTSMAEWIVAAIDGKKAIACVESVGAMPGQGVSGMFNFGYSVGAIHGILAALGIPRYIVSPVRWQKTVLGRTARKEVISKDGKPVRKKDETVAVDFVRSAYPSVSLLATDRSKKPHSGIADAICIARYAHINL